MSGADDDWIKYRLREGLDPGRFEELCMALLEAEGHRQIHDLGSAGNDGGVDVSSLGPDGRRWVIQCKRTRTFFGPGKAVPELEKILESPPDPPVEVYRLMATCNISVGTQKSLEACAGSTLEVASPWTLNRIVALLHRYPDLLPRFIGATGTEPPSPAHQEISRKLLAAESALDSLRDLGEPTTAAEGKVRRLKRRLRDGAQLRPGDILGGVYQLKGMLGKGGFATVWRARHRKTRQLVAVKVLHGQYARDASRRRRFFRGAREMVRLGEHPNLVRVLVAEAEDDGYYYFVMELIAGGDFQQERLRSQWSRDDALQVIYDVGAVLELAHSQGIVHRDVKPANILLGANGRAKLTDFDLVKVGGDSTGNTRTDAAMGTYVYAAPDALQDAKHATASADVYSLAMTTLFALHGQKLPHTIINATGAFLEPLDLSSAIKEVLRRATSFHQAERFTTVGEFCTALRQAVAEPVVSVASAPPDVDEMSPVFDPQRFTYRLLDSGTDDIGRWEAIELAGVEVRFRWIEPGTFLMGSPDTESGRYVDEGPQHPVTLTQGYWLAETPTVQALWQSLSGKNPSRFDGLDRPVERVSWEDCQLLLQAAAVAVPDLDLRLPTEAEWEYGCRAGSQSSIYPVDPPANTESADLKSIAWYGENSFGETHPVGEKLPNAWGLYDMLGNVDEWCQDWNSDYSPGEATDPSGPEQGAYRVVRGGAWSDSALSVRAAYRNHTDPSNRYDLLGFRLARGQSALKPAEPEAGRAEPAGAERLPRGPRLSSPRPGWARRSGSDRYGKWVLLDLDGVEQRFRWIPPGRFLMGESGSKREQVIENGFWLGDTPVTQVLWLALMEKNPSHFEGATHPVETVSYHDCQEFISRLNERLGEELARLPTEAEWEYACRAATETATYQADLDSIAWHGGNSNGTIHPVTQKQPNDWGLFDMLGSVWEWCEDLWQPDQTTESVATNRVLRGGAWDSSAQFVRAAFRVHWRPSGCNDDLGIRLVLGKSALKAGGAR